MTLLRSARPLAFILSVTFVAPAIALTPAVVLAQPKKPASTRDQLPLEARGHWDAGIALAGKKEWEPARSSFLAAYDISKNPRVLFNVGVAEKELSRFAQAQETWKRELAEGKGKLTPDEERELNGLIAGLDQFVGKVTINVSEKDAEVYVDKDRVDASKLPGPITISIGHPTIRAVKPGFAEASEALSIAGGDNKTVNLKLQPLVKTAKVNVSVVGPPNAVVKIDGREVGPAPYTGQVPVTADPHQFSAEAPGYVAATQSAIVHENEALNLTLQLAQDQAKGKLIVITRPEGASIEIDGQLAGASHWEGPVDAKTHQILVRKQGYYDWSYDVDVPKGESRTVSAVLNENRNTSFVPWLVGTIVIGAAVIGGIVILSLPNDETPTAGTLPPNTVRATSLRPLHKGLAIPF